MPSLLTGESMTTETEHTPQVEQLLTGADVCRIFQIDRSALCRGWKRGILPEPIRLNRRFYRWRAADVRQFIDNHPMKGSNK